MRRGFTLFEVLVSLGLSVVLMTLIGFALQFFAIQLNERDSEARRTQLARSILRLIAQDLQSCVYPEEFDASNLASLLASSTGGEVSGGGGGTTTDTGDDEVVVDDVSDDTSDLSAVLLATVRPGLIGNQYQLQFDVSRLPRLEEYLPMLQDASELGIQDLPSDLKTVSYYVQQEGTAGASDSLAALQETGPSSDGGGGLVRRTLDRAVTGYALETGDSVRLEQTGEVLAPEVGSVEFAYFDGTQWIYEWNSDELGGLPLAIQIQLTLSGKQDSEGQDAAAGITSDGLEVAQGEVYQLMVRLPMAVPLPLEEETEEDLSAAGI